MDENLRKHSSVFWIEVDKIKPNPMQPRREFDEARLIDLSESIRQYGVLQPLVVTRKETETPSGTIVEYELIAGERRLRASKLSGLSQVPVIIRDDEGEKIKLELAIIENLQREDLNALERAKAFKKLIEDFKLKHHEVAAKVGKSREYVTNTVRLLSLPSQVQEGLVKGEISEGHCRPIMMLNGRIEDQIKLYSDIVAKKLTVRVAEQMSRSVARERARRADMLSNPEMKSIEEKLSENLGTRVQIECFGERGRISIDFFSSEEFQALIRRMAEEKIAGSRESKMADETTSENIFENSMQNQNAETIEHIFPSESEQPDDMEEIRNNFTI